MFDTIIRDGLLRLGYPESEVDRRLASRFLDPDAGKSMRLMTAAILASRIESTDELSPLPESTPDQQTLIDELTADALRTADHQPNGE